jgi:hypothetical protein
VQENPIQVSTRKFVCPSSTTCPSVGNSESSTTVPVTVIQWELIIMFPSESNQETSHVLRKFSIIRKYESMYSWANIKWQ